MKLIIALMVFSFSMLSNADDGKFKDHISLMAIDIPATSTITQAEIECQKREDELSGKLNQISSQLKAPAGKLSLRTQVDMYGSGQYYGDYELVCSLSAKSTDTNFGFRLNKAPVRKGDDRIKQCMADVEAFKNQPNILLAQFDETMYLPFVVRCQAYGVEVGQP